MRSGVDACVFGVRAFPTFRPASACGKVVVMPSTKGSSGNTMFVRIASLEGKAPAALIHKEIDSPLVLACAIANIPLVQIGETEFGSIQDGDWIEVDADEGIIEVKRKG